MHRKLREIIEHKHREVERLKRELCATDLPPQSKSAKTFRDALSSNELTFIGEVKRRSPSKGPLADIKNIQGLLEQYLKGGVSALSILTDAHYFGGSMEDLTEAIQYVSSSKIPVLRKEFIIDKIQILESAHAGAHAILLIVAVLQENTAEFLKYAKNLGLDVIVEVHTHSELELALSINADIIGVNNRDLNTFSEDLKVCLSLAQYIPENILSIAESAIKTPEDISKIKSAGFDGVLIGESLVKAENPEAFLKKMKVSA